MKDTTVVIPIVNENPKILRQLTAKLKRYGAEVIVVDDGSKRPYKSSLKHGQNFGYGAAILTGCRQAKRPLILTMDGDNQHRPEDARNLWKAWHMLKRVDMLIGLRRLQQEKWYRMLGRKAINIFASLIATYWLPDLNSGLRIFKRDIVLGYAPILCPSFSFTTSLTMSFLCDGLRIEWFPIYVEPRKHGWSKVKLIRHGFVTLYYAFRIGMALRTRGLRKWLRHLRGKTE